MQTAIRRYVEGNTPALLQSSAPMADVRAAADVARARLHGAHRLVAGQSLQVTLQVWQDTPGKITCRQLCPMMAYGGAQGKASFSGGLQSLRQGQSMEPVFQFVVGRTYYISFLIQNRDPTNLRRQPFTDAVEVRSSCIL
jgi:hypothetical protein